MHPYLDALNALHVLLEFGRLVDWRDQVALAIDEWETAQRVDHHWRAYGGMGSLTDVVWRWPGKDEGHTALLGAAFDDVRDVCMTMAQALVENPQAGLISTLGPVDLQVDGMVCPVCGYAEVRPQAVEATLMAFVARQGVNAGLRTQTLAVFARRCTRNDVGAVDGLRQHLVSQLKARGVVVRKRQRPMVTCLNCGAETVPTRWSAALVSVTDN